MSKKITHEEYIKKVENKFGQGNYEILNRYADAYTPIVFRHTVCGTRDSVVAREFLRGKGCKKCSKARRVKRQRIKRLKKFENELRQKYSNRICVFGEYKGIESNMIFYDTECGTFYYTNPRTVLRSKNAACPLCVTRSVPKSNLQFQQEVEELVGDEYTFLEQYVGAHCKIKCRHNRCGHVWSTQPCNFLTGYGCPKCSQSQGERTISKWLRDRDIHSIPQKKFIDCFDKSCLPFDFYVPQYNLAIEYDGEQHYKPEIFFGGEEAYKIRHRHDLIKNKYCEDNNINLLRIPYTVTGEDIGKVIQNKLDELTQLDNIA